LARQQAFASAMVALLARYARPGRAVRKIGREPQAIRRALDYANARFSEPGLSITQLARAAGLSDYHFMRCFRATTGLTAHQYVLQLRLREARHLLAHDTPPSAVACTVGFADQSHLNRHFRAAFGVTPGQYAKATRRQG
jgi:AraC-like DNA-binding protein